jgi:hypothetical protein
VGQGETYQPPAAFRTAALRGPAAACRRER